MDIVRTGLGITRTIKNVARSKEILSVFARNGFDEIIIKTGLYSRVPGLVLPRKRIALALGDSEYHGDDWWRAVGYRLRKSFEELGPSFIKIGQLLSSREDLFPPPFIRQMKLLQNKVKPIPFAESKKVIEKSLDKKIEDVFDFIDEDPIGVASIGIVYKGTLKSGEDVVIKVKRPDIDALIENDFDILDFVVAQIEKVSEDFKYIGASRVLSDFRKTIRTELDFNIEAMNCERLGENLRKLDKDKIFILPNAFKQYTTREVIVLDYLKGKPFNEVKSLDELSPRLIENLEKSVGLFIHTLLADGFFHADLHGGNFFLLENDQIGLIDFGLMGNLGKNNRTNLIAILYALVTNNYENLVYEFLDVAEFDKIPNQESLIRDVRDAIMPYVGLSIQETNISDLVSHLLRTLSKHKVYLPREWFIVFRAMMTLDGVGKSIGLDFNVYKLINSEIGDIASEMFSFESAKEEIVWLGRDTINSLKILPRHIKWFLREFSKKNYSIDLNLKADKTQVKQITRGLIFIGQSFLSSMFLIGGILTLGNNDFPKFYSIPVMSWILWFFSALFLFRGLSSIRK